MKILSLLVLILLFMVAPLNSAVLVGFGEGTGVYVSDSFTGANGAALSGNWTHNSAPDGFWGNFLIWINEATTPSNRTGYAYWSADTFTANHKSCAEIRGTLSTTSGYAGVTVRHSTAASTKTNYTLLQINGTYSLIKTVAGTDTSLLTLTETPVLNDVICLSATGSSTTTLSATVNGGTAQTYDDSSSPITTGQPGIIARKSTQEPKLDNWTGEDL